MLTLSSLVKSPKLLKVVARRTKPSLRQLPRKASRKCRQGFLQGVGSCLAAAPSEREWKRSSDEEGRTVE